MDKPRPFANKPAPEGRGKQSLRQASHHTAAAPVSTIGLNSSPSEFRPNLSQSQRDGLDKASFAANQMSSALVLRPSENASNARKRASNDSDSDASTQPEFDHGIQPGNDDSGTARTQGCNRKYYEMYCIGDARQFNSELFDNSVDVEQTSKLDVSFNRCFSDGRGLQFNGCMSTDSVLAILRQTHEARGDRKL